MGDINPIYQRQETLELNVPASAMIVGCGGVGFYAAQGMALAGTPRLLLFDPDVVEASNLNRLPLKRSDIGKPKVNVVREHLIALRPEAIVEAHKLVITPELMTLFKPEAVIDCTDRFKIQQGLSGACHKNGIRYVRAGYDGLHITVTPEVKAWEVTTTEEDEYRVVPSFYPTAAIAGALACYSILRAPEFRFSGSLEDIGNRKGGNK